MRRERDPVICGQILTIGTEITSGEVINTNASWLAQRLEGLGIRIRSHLSVRDQRDEIRAALKWLTEDEFEMSLLFITGGLGPTSDDQTRAAVAEYFGDVLEFDDEVWQGLEAQHRARGLPVREAHRHQCWFPRTSERLKNPVGTALGFYLAGSKVFVLPGPPRELEGMFEQEVLARLKTLLPPQDLRWHHWSVFAVPESEVAELIEPIVLGSNLEVGYRAQVPYVRVKIFAHPERDRQILTRIEQALASSAVPHDLAEQVVALWPDPVLPVWDEISEGHLLQRLYSARRRLNSEIKIESSAGGLSLQLHGESFQVQVVNSLLDFKERRELPFKISLQSERGRRSAAEWALFLAFTALRD